MAIRRGQLGGALGRAVELEVQRRHGVDLQALEEAVADEAGRFVQRLLALGRVADEHREEDRRVRVVGRDLDGMDRHHADARILQVADQLGDVALDLVGDAEAPVRDRWFVSHGVSSLQARKQEPRRLLEGGVRERAGTA